MNLNSQIDADADTLIENIATKYKPVFSKGNYSIEQNRAIYRYLFSQRPKKLPPSLRNRIINLYDPLADRTKRFPDGLRFCLNVYVGCQHACGYCYVNGYSKDSVSFSPHVKQDFERKLIKDINDIKILNLPVTPIHLSNSTDICQEKLESSQRHTLFSLKQIHENRHLFSSVVLLTKNPSILCQKEYLNILKNGSMAPLTVQISCAFWRDEVRKFYEPDTPDVQNRLSSFKILCENGINTDLRIDPLFPSSDILPAIRRHKPLKNYNLPEPQTNKDLTNLVQFVKSVGGNAILSKPLKIPISDNAKKTKMWFEELYKDANPQRKSKVQGGSYRLPDQYQQSMMLRVKKICNENGITFKYCKQDVLTRK